MKTIYNDFLGVTLSEENLIREVELVRERARQAEKEIKLISLNDRLHIIKNLKKVLYDKRYKILEVIQKESFKSSTDILTSEIYGPIDFLGFVLKNAKKSLRDQKVPTPIALMGKKSFIYYEPLGTALSIVPWNYPLFNPIIHAATSFVCGNATIIKPSEVTPMKGLIEEILSEAGFSNNWVQIVYGDGLVGKALIDTYPDKIFFVGSVETGKKVMAQASKNLIPVELELGGKDPMIVFEDANIHRATSGALWGGLTASGQSCTSVERLMVHESIYESFKKSLIKKAAEIQVGDGANPDFEIGPMVTDFQTKIVREHLEDALNKGATLLTGNDWDRTSRFIPPLILEGVTRDMIVYSEETFGPIIPIYKFSTEKEALEMANDSDYGLSASIWSEDIEKCKRVARNIKTGNISINNVMLTEGNANLPFGGCKLSGFGRFKGLVGFHSFTMSKSVLIDKNSNLIESHWYPYDNEKHNLFKKMISSLYSGNIWGIIKALIFSIKLEKYSQKNTPSR
ncbi:MAG: aldehyde dehydrogenase family protein [Bdellovibrionales bacterium]|nr:aldehyde dehydrogenase family protein [Bdellovibrionales bacterium]